MDMSINKKRKEEKCENKLEYPETKKIPTISDYHGRKVEDDYRWLEENNKDTAEWLEKQNSLAEDFLSQIVIRKRVKEDLGDIEIQDRSIYIPSNGRYFYTKCEPGQNQSVLYYKDGLEGEEKVLLDLNKMSDDGSKSLESYSVSPDSRYVAFQIETNGEDKTSIQVIEVETKKILDDYIRPIMTDIEWSKDSSGFYYTKFTGNEKSYRKEDKLFFHRIGTEESSDIGIFGKELASEKQCFITSSVDSEYIYISVNEGIGKNELYYKKNEIGSEVKLLIPGDGSSMFEADSVGNHVFVLTDKNANNGRVVTFDINGSHLESEWREVVPKSRNKIDSFLIVGNYLLLSYISNASSILKLADKEGTMIKKLNLPSFGTVTDIVYEFGKNEFFFEFDSFTTPYTIYKCEIPECKLQKIYQAKVGMDTSRIKSRQVWYKSKDGTRIPMFIVYKKGIVLNGDNPTVLYGYGGFDDTESPSFEYNIASFIQNGGVFALPNIRGGGEFGERWHNEGILGKKQNSFDDFIAAAEYLIENKYTNSGRLVTNGSSNGGLLVAACMMQRPELYKAVVCEVPLLDMLNYDKFGIGKFWIEEYGDVGDPDAFEYLQKYSPYHNVKPGVEYPAVLFTAADNDNRVSPMHAMKMAALMQSMAPSNPVLLRMEVNAGHGSGKSATKAINELVDIWTFIYSQLGMNDIDKEAARERSRKVLRRK